MSVASWSGQSDCIFYKLRSKPKILHVLFFWVVEKFSCFLLHQNSQNHGFPQAGKSSWGLQSHVLLKAKSELNSDQVAWDSAKLTIPSGTGIPQPCIKPAPVLFYPHSKHCCGVLLDPLLVHVPALSHGAALCRAWLGLPCDLPMGLADGSSVLPRPSLFLLNQPPSLSLSV